MLVLNSVKVVTEKDGKSKTANANILPHTLYLIGDHFYHAGDIKPLYILGQRQFSNLEKYLLQQKVDEKVVDATIGMAHENLDKLYENENWDELRQSKHWEWACVRMLAYEQGYFTDEIKYDPAETIYERFRKLSKAK